MSTQRQLVLIIVVGVLVVSLVGGTRIGCSSGGGIDPDKVEESISRHMKKVAGVQPTVDCPEDVPLEAGHKFECSVKADGEAFDYVVEQTDDKGTIAFRPARIVIPALKMERLLEDRTKKRTSASASVNCGKRLHLIDVGGAFVCKVSPGPPSHIRVRLTDDEGNVVFEPLSD